MAFKTKTITNQNQALVVLAQLVQAGMESPRVRETALKIVNGCGSRDDYCELQALYDAVKHGTPEIKGLEKGFPYRADPRTLDWFIGPERALKMCEDGACGDDCDGHSVLLASLAGAIGFTTGLRAYGKPRETGFSHVYAVVLTPKKASVSDLKGLSDDALETAGIEIVGMDSTVPSAYLGWQPPNGRYRTAWIDEE